MPTATFLHEGAAIDYTPAADVAAGDVVVQGELVGIARTAIAAGALGSLAVQGVFVLPKAGGVGSAIDVGVDVYWDAGNSVATADADGGNNKLLGKTVLATTDDDTEVRVRLRQ